MRKNDYLKRVEYNTSLVEETLKNKKQLNTILDKVYTYDSKPGEIHWSLLMPKWADIIPAVFLGHLPVTDENTGADGIKYCKDTDTFVETEYKVSTFRSSKLICGINGGLQIPLSNANTRPTGVTSYISAAFQIHSEKNLETKDRETYLCLTDVDNKDFTFIDIFCLQGNNILDSLSKSNKKKRSVTLGYFKNHGIKANTLFPVMSWDLFEIDQKRQKHQSPKIREFYQKKYDILMEELYV